MSLDQAVRNVQIPLVSVPAMMAIRAPNVTLLVVVIQQVQVGQHVISLQVNARAIMAILVLPVLLLQVRFVDC